MSKEKIFALLSAQAGDFVSGEDISAQLGISRAAVWKAVGALRRDGYTIEAQTGLGYRLAEPILPTCASCAAASARRK